MVLVFKRWETLPKPDVKLAERLPCPEGRPGSAGYTVELETTTQAEASGWEAPWDNKYDVQDEVLR